MSRKKRGVRFPERQRLMIRAENLYFSYSASQPFVLNGINFELKDGEYVSVVGENGCGKTTLMKLILGFIKPVRGKIITEARRIGYVPQKQGSVNSGFPITLHEMLDSYRRLLNIRDRGAVRDALGRVGLEEFSSALVDTLSGGQSQKALIARAMLGSPELIILDEPSSGIDPSSQKEIYGLLKKLNKENGVTIVSVEHNLEAAVLNSTAIYHLSMGKGHICTPKSYAEEYLKGRGES